MTIAKKISKIAEKALNLANKGSQKLEDYAQKSAEENNNKNAQKLASGMNKLNHSIEENKETYLKKVEENADELINQGKAALEKLKTICQKNKDSTKDKQDK